MKRVVYVLSIVMFCLVLTGCVKESINMNINSDKSMNLSLIFAIPSEYKEYLEEDSFSKEDRLKFEKEGYTINEYNENNMVGYTISKVFSNIDDISLNEEVTYYLSDLFESDTDKFLFSFDKGYIKNKYDAHFIFDTEDTTTEEEIDPELSEAINNATEVTFNVSLPYSAISNNATTSSNDTKELSWNLLESSDIKFEFEIYNKMNVYVLLALIITTCLGILIFIIKCLLDAAKKTISREKPFSLEGLDIKELGDGKE